MPNPHRQLTPLASPQRSPPPPPAPPQSHTNSAVINNGAWSPTRQVSLQQPSNRKNNRQSRNKIMRRVRSAFRSFPVITPTCRIPVSLNGAKLNDVHGGTRITGTLFGYRKSRINLAFQENSRCVPVLLLELAIPTGKLLHDMGLGLVRIALECEKHPSRKTKLIEEPIWTMYCNGKKAGYGIKREPTDDDLSVMKLLHAVSMGAGVLPSDGNELSDGELTYMRAYFERAVGSRDSETYYMVGPDGNSGPELSVFFVRI